MHVGDPSHRIVSFSWAATKLGLAQFPKHMNLSDLAIVGSLGSIGFTMCIFLIEQSLAGRMAGAAKVSVMAASMLSAVLSAVALSRVPRDRMVRLDEAMQAKMGTGAAAAVPTKVPAVVVRGSTAAAGKRRTVVAASATGSTAGAPGTGGSHNTEGGSGSPGRGSRGGG